MKGLQYLGNLRKLILSSNYINRAKQIAYVIDIPFLTEIDLCYNEVQKRKFYRFYVSKIILIIIVNFTLTSIKNIRWSRHIT